MNQHTDELSGLMPVTRVSGGAPVLTKAGRSKGSTDDEKREDTKTLSDLVNAIAFD